MFSNTPHTRTCMLHSPVYHCVFGCTITLVYCPWRSRPPYSVTSLHTHTHTHMHATLTCLPLCIRLRRNTGVLPMEIQTPCSVTPLHTHTHTHTHTCMLHSPVNSCVFGCAITLVYCPWRSRPPYSVTPLHTHTHTHATLTCLPLCIRLHRNTGVLPMEIQTPMFSNPPPHTHTHACYTHLFTTVYLVAP